MDDDQTEQPARVMRVTPQQWYDDNRERFDAQTSVADLKMPERCSHDGFLSLNGNNEIECTQCRAGWKFPPYVRVEDGSIVIRDPK